MVIALIGNQNSGKTTLFNALTGSNQHTGNFPGVTVEKKEGYIRKSIKVVDLPGVYSLSPHSLEEIVTRDFLLKENPDVIINILDATSPERNLFLTLQLTELNTPMILALNFMDEVQKNGNLIRTDKLEKLLGVYAVPISAIKRNGIDELTEKAVETAKKQLIPNRYAPDYKNAEKICYECFLKRSQTIESKRSIKIDKILAHKYFGMPIFFAVMLFIFYFTFGSFGSYLSDLFSKLIDCGINMADSFLDKINISPILRSFLIDGALKGVGSVLSFLPTILTLFFFLALLEDSGYMARIAFIMDKPLRKIGLSGKSFVPLLMGFGCSVPAIMATRTLTSNRDRKMTILLIPFMSCSAKLPIYAFFAQTFFPNNAAVIICVLYAIGIICGVLVGMFFNGKDSAPFIIELPPYRFPSFKSVIINITEKAKSFFIKAFTVIFAASSVIWFLDFFGVLTDSGKFLAPAFAPIGFSDERLIASLITGLTAKETVISTLTVLAGENVSGLFKSDLSVMSFLIFTLLYTPCSAAIAAAKKETNTKTAFGLALFQFLFAWLCAFVFYNIGLILKK